MAPLMIAALFGGEEGAAEIVDILVRAGADETNVDHYGNTPADVVCLSNEGADQPAEDAERVRELLANAPADRAWRRRGYFLLCRSHPERLQHNHIEAGRRGRPL